MNNLILGMIGVWEIGIILLMLLVMAGLAVGVIWLVVWLGRRNQTPPSPPVNSTRPQQTPPPTSAACPRCGATLPPDSPQGLCPRCVLGVGLDTQTEATGEFGPHGTKLVPPPEAEVAKRFPHLEILGCLGHGGMGVVYKARQPKLNRLVALKILAPEKGADPKFAERFLREAQALARLSHPNIVTVHDFGEADGMFFLLMEYVDGMTLRQLLREGLMKPEEALAIVPKICEALQFAHEQGVVHRDIKPENVLLDKQGRVKIADFGIAKIIDGRDALPRGQADPQVSPASESAKSQNLTQDQIIGTPHYMAPEQVEKPATVDHRADIYSLGVVFYEMLTGELPLGKFQPPSKKVQVDVRLDEVVLHALEKEPERRYQQASQVMTDVETIVRTPTGSSRGDEPQTEESGGKEGNSQSILTSSPTNQEPRFSRTAIAGARWTGIAATVFALGVLLPFFLQARPGGWEMSLLAVTASIGTILGWLAVSQIRRSAGKLRGMWLGVFDGLLFPMLALNYILVGGIILGIGYQGPPWTSYWWLGLAAASALALIDVLIIRRVWRAVNTPSASGYASRVAWVGALAVAIMILAVVVAAFSSGRNGSTASLANSPHKLKSLPTVTVIQAGLGEPDSPWAWRELEQRAKTGRLGKVEAEALLDELTAWMRRSHPDGYEQPLHWLRGLLNELGKHRLVTDEKVLAFLEAFHGQPKCEPLVRVRENEPQPALSLTCRWRSPWHEELFGLKLLNEMRSITIAGKEATWRDVHPNCEQYEFYGSLELPALAPGKYSVRFEIESALIPKQDLVGLAPDTLSPDWPSAKRRWTRVCESELIVYPKQTEIVRLTEDPALDPVASGALSVKQVIIRSDGNRTTAAAAVFVLEKDNTGQKLLVPVSFDVTLRVSGENYRCGHFWSAAKGTRGGFTPNRSSRSELGADINPLGAEVQEAEVVLTPNPKAVEREGSIDRIWGREIVFPRVRLVRQDIREAGKPYFGPVIERVLPDPDNGGGRSNRETLHLRTGERSSVLDGAPKESGGRLRALVASEGDLFAEYDDFVSGRWAFVTGGLKLSDFLSRQWETATPGDVDAALKQPSALQRVEHSGATLYYLPDGLLPLTFAFESRTGERGLLQITGFSDNPRTVTIRYKLVNPSTQ